MLIRYESHSFMFEPHISSFLLFWRCLEANRIGCSKKNPQKCTAKQQTNIFTEDFKFIFYLFEPSTHEQLERILTFFFPFQQLTDSLWPIGARNGNWKSRKNFPCAVCLSREFFYVEVGEVGFSPRHHPSDAEAGGEHFCWFFLLCSESVSDARLELWFEIDVNHRVTVKVNQNVIWWSFSIRCIYSIELNPFTLINFTLTRDFLLLSEVKNGGTENDGRSQKMLSQETKKEMQKHSKKSATSLAT